MLFLPRCRFGRAGFPRRRQVFQRLDISGQRQDLIFRDESPESWASPAETSNNFRIRLQNRFTDVVVIHQDRRAIGQLYV
jgi:hypothetical protein